MIADDEKRHSEVVIATPQASDQVVGEGVGGRQAEGPPQAGGGGYPKNCTILNFSTSPEKKCDPRLDELREMGLQRVWLDVAEAIGVDSMLLMWRILSGDPARISDDGRILVPIRSYGAYLRYQRNRYIESLSSMGLSADQIRQKLREQIGEEITNRHIGRIRKRG